MSTVIDSMSSGFTVDMSVSTPSTITRAEPPEPIEFSAPRMRTVAPRLGLPSEKVIVRPGMAPCNEREMLIDEPMRSSRPFDRKGFDGTYDVAALLYAVTDDDNLFEAGVVFAHGDVDGGLVVDVDCLGFVAHIAEIQAFGIVSIDRVRTVGIGSRAFRGTGDGDGDTYEGISRVVFNDTRDGLPPPLVPRPGAQMSHIKE